MRVKFAAVLLIALTACASNAPPIRIPGPVEYRDRLVVVPVPAESLKPHPIAVGTLAQCPFVAAERKRELLACNADKAAIEAMQDRDEKNRRRGDGGS